MPRSAKNAQRTEKNHRAKSLARPRKRAEATYQRIDDFKPPATVTAPLTPMERLTAWAEQVNQQKSALEVRSRYLEMALNNMSRGLSMYDAKQNLVICNNTYQETYSIPEFLTQPGTPFATVLEFYVQRDQGPDAEVDIEGLNKWIDGHVAKISRGSTFSEIQELSSGRSISITYSPLAGGGWVDVQEDITDKKKADEKIDWLARHDMLTGIPNRLHFRGEIERMLGEVHHNTCDGFALIWLDLDRFKHVNDTLGHPVGDGLLKAVAERLNRSIRQTDHLARLGGDEFALLLPSTVNAHHAEVVAKRILRTISEPYNIFGHEVKIGVSIGIALAPNHGKDVETLLTNADLAMYDAKTSGRGRYAFYSAEKKGEMAQRHELAAALSNAIELDQLLLHYQPIVDIHERKVIRLEALLRWEHPVKGMVSPADFIPLAEETGLIVDIGRWVISRACQDASNWPQDIGVSVNLSAVQIERSDVEEIVTTELANSGLAPSRLELEVTESMLLRDDARTIKMMLALKARGVRIALDDFGTAYASMSYLRSFPFDEIKIDRSFIHDLPHGRGSVAIVKAVSGLAASLDMETVAEGVETIEQVHAIHRAGCSGIQGYYFSRPVPAGGIAAALDSCASKLAALDWFEGG